MTDTPFWEKPLRELDRAQWEQLCDGCGKCCLHKLEDEATGEIHGTNVTCKLLDAQTGRCSNYRQR
ncbi:MAG TPA: YkgJ family cysteine cluster protein, partial [Allosphingosinicella sp.]